MAGKADTKRAPWIQTSMRTDGESLMAKHHEAAEEQRHHVPLSLWVWAQPGVSTACSPLWTFRCQSSTKASGPNRKILRPFPPQSFAKFELQPPRSYSKIPQPRTSRRGTRSRDDQECHQPGSTASGTDLPAPTSVPKWTQLSTHP